MKELLVISIIWFGYTNLSSQLLINDPIPYKDSLNIKSVVVYEIDNFICTDTSITIIELDSLARIRKKSKYIKNKLYSEHEHFLDEKSNRYVRSVKIQEEDLELEIPQKIYYDFGYDNIGNIISMTGKTDVDSILNRTVYYYNGDNTINRIEYVKVAMRFKYGKPYGTIDSFNYNFKGNLVETIRIKPNGSRKVINQSNLVNTRFDLSNIENDMLEFKEEVDNRKTRTVFWFDDRKNIIRTEGYMSLKNKDGDFGEESKVYTKIQEIEYR